MTAISSHQVLGSDLGQSLNAFIDISCNGRRNVLLNNYIIDKFVDTINGFVCNRIFGVHSFL